MSGVEAAGFVLAVIPLITSALEHYANGAEKMRMAWNHSREFRSLVRKLDAENTCFRNSVEILLSDCVDIDKQKKLMEDIAGKSWSDQAIEDALRARLRASYNSYVDSVRAMRSTVTLLQQRLALDTESKVPYTNRKLFRRAYRSLQFAIRQSRYMELVREIRDDNVVIERLSTQAHALQSRRKARRLPDYDKTRAEATGVFESLQKGLHASCRIPHRVNLYLKLDKDDSNGKATDNLPNISGSFHVVMHHELGVGSQRPPPWYMKEAEMRLLDEAFDIPESPQPTRSSSIFHIPGRLRRMAIQFREPQRSVRDDQRPPFASLRVAPQQKLNEIRDLCGSIQKHLAAQQGGCLGYVTGVSSRHRHGLYYPRHQLLDRTMTLSLAHVLERPQHVSCKLRHADAHRLAVSLASAMLQLHDTPWMPKDWNTRDIILLSQNGRVIDDFPFISRSMQASVIPDQTPSPVASVAHRVIRNPTLHRLGIVLIELCMEKSMHELHLPDELNTDGTAHELSEYYTAARLLDNEEIRDKFGSRWSDVVRYCVFCSKPRLQNMDLRREVYNEVVLELEEACRQFSDL